MNALILYYSLGGNTRKIAEMIYKKIGGDMAEIQTIQPYRGSYEDIVNQGQNEVNSGYMPEIKTLSIDIFNYDTIIVGSPVWWYTFAPAMHTFLKHNSLSGKQVYPFATNGGWIGHTFADFEKACKNANVHSGLNVRFDNSSQITSEQKILEWTAKIS